MALSWWYYSPQRAHIADFIDMVPITRGEFDFYVRSGKRDTLRLTTDMVHSLLLPLHTDVWLLLCEYSVVSSGSCSVSIEWCRLAAAL